MAKNILKPVVDRQKSGYTREFNPLDVFLFNVMGFALGLALSTNPTFIGGFAPTANILIVICLGAVLAFLNGLIYGWFGAIMPNTGGDFVFVSRSIGHRIGFLTSWGFTLCQLYGMAMNIGWIISMAIAPSLITIGNSFNNTELISLATLLTKDYLVVGSIVIVVFYWLISILGFTLNKGIAIILFIIGIFGPALIGYVFYTHNHQDFINAFNSYMNNPDAYNAVLNAAKDSGMALHEGNMWKESFRAMPIGFLCFLGFTYSVYVGGEVEKPEKSQIKGILFALSLGLLTFLTCMGEYINVVGQDFNAAIGNPDVLEQVGLPANSMNFIAGIISENKWLNLIMQVGNSIWFLLVPYIMLQVCTRNIMAWTLDGLLPDFFLKRTKKTNVPWLASLVVSIVAIICILLINYTGLSLIGAIALAAVAYFFTSISAWLLPKTNPTAFANAPKFAKGKFLGIFETNFQIIGLICAIGFLWIIYAAIGFPEISGGTPFRAILMVLGVYLIGLLFYQWRKRILKEKEISANIDLDKLFKEIPTD